MKQSFLKTQLFSDFFPKKKYIKHFKTRGFLVILCTKHIDLVLKHIFAFTIYSITLIFLFFFFRSKFSASDKRTLALLSYFSRTKMNNRLSEPCADPSSLQTPSLLSCIPYRIPWSCLAIHVMHTEVTEKQMYTSYGYTFLFFFFFWGGGGRGVAI